MKRLLAAAVLSLAPWAAYAESLGMQSDWLELVKGERCEVSGAEIMSVSQHPETGHHTVMVKVPKAGLSEQPDMEEVRVVGQAPEKTEMPNPLPELETEWVDDYDNNHYGLLVKLNSKQKVPIRLFVSAQDGYLDGGVPVQ